MWYFLNSRDSIVQSVIVRFVIRCHQLVFFSPSEQYQTSLHTFLLDTLLKTHYRTDRVREHCFDIVLLPFLDACLFTADKYHQCVNIRIAAITNGLLNSHFYLICTMVKVTLKVNFDTATRHIRLCSKIEQFMSFFKQSRIQL